MTLPIEARGASTAVVAHASAVAAPVLSICDATNTCAQLSSPPSATSAIVAPVAAPFSSSTPLAPIAMSGVDVPAS